MKQWYKYMFGVSLVILLVATSWPFINGTLTDTTHWQSKDIKSHVKMDPQYEEALSYIRSLPADGKILSLPLTDHGYQVVKGENDAAYIGPSTITYLTNKSEFMGFDEFGIFGPIFLEAARDKDYLALQDMLAMFNIKYIFYNSDPYIYGDNFPAFPYRHVPKFLPPNQEEYKVFIENLEVEKKADFGDKYHIYEIKDKEYLPHIYAAKRTAYWSDNLVNLHTPLSFYPQDKRVAFYDDIKIFGRNEHIFDDILLKAQNKHQIFYFFKTKDFPKFVSPFVSQKPSSFIYPLVVLREKKDLEGFSTIDDEYIDRSTYFAEKRINELVKWTEIPVRKNVERIADLADAWQEPKLWEFRRYIEYNSWEITLARYQQAIEKLIGELEAENQSPYSSITNKVALKNILIEHRDKLRGALRQDSSRSIEEKRYLFSLVDEMFADIFTGLNLTLPDDWIIPYEVGNPLKDGRYEVYVSRDDIKNLEIALDIDKMRLFPKSSEEGDWIRFDDIVVENKSSLPITVTVNKMPDFVAQTKWKTAEQTMQTIVEGAEFETDRQNETKEDSATFTVFTITYSYLANTSGLIRDISEWEQDKIYIISFDYLTYNQNFLLALYERGGTKKNPYVSQTYSEELRSKEWKKFKAAVLSKEDAQSAFVQISKGQDDIQDQAYAEGIKKFEIRDLSVVQVPNPLIVLKRVVQPQEASTPQITFKKINPTKYKVSVSGATDPYNLVLSERFNPRWKIFSVNKANEARTLKGWISRVLGRIATGIVRAQNIVISSDAGKGSLTSYFDSDIIEGMHENVFLDQNTFETFGYDPIAEATHLPANGYANGWYITTKEVQNEQDYELIIEMTSQKLFYGSVLLSIGGLFLLVFMLLKSFIKIPK